MSELPGSISDENAPILRVLSDAQLRRFHDAALELLQDPGIQVTTEEGRKLLLDAGCSPAGEDIVRIPAQLVEDALASAPETFALYDRNGDERALLGEGRAYFGTGVTALKYEDPDSGEVHNFTLADFAEVARLTDALENLDFIASPGVVRPSADLPLSTVNQCEFLEMTANTVKPVMPLVADGAALADIFEMAAIVAGGREELRQRPFVTPYLNSVSPLVFNPETLDKLLLSADWGIPVCCQPGPTLGATGPVTVGGTTALSAAETLAALVISQVRREGAPFIAGAVPMSLDMRTGELGGGGMESMLAALASSELARFWHLPQVGSGASSDSKLADEQAAAEVSAYILCDILSGVDLAFDAGGIEMGLSHSAHLMVLVDEVVAMFRTMLRGVPTDDENLALDTIRSVGPGGQYLGTQHTLKHFREMRVSTLMDSGSRLDWRESGSKTLRDRMRERALDLIGSHEPERLPDDMVTGMQAVIDERRRASAVGGA